MKKILTLILFLLPALALAQTSPIGPFPTLTGSNWWRGDNLFDRGIIAHTSGTQAQAVMGWSQSGASAGFFVQDTDFSSPAVLIQRTGTDGDSTASPTLMVQAGRETAWNQPVAQFGGCVALSGDNWVITWADGSLSASGGLMDGGGEAKGVLSIDLRNRQLIGPNGVSAALSWNGAGVQVGDITVSGSLILSGSATIPASRVAPTTAASAPANPALGQVYFNTTDAHFYGWNGTAWKQLDN